MLRRLAIMNATLFPLALGACAGDVPPFVVNPPPPADGGNPPAPDGGLYVLHLTPPSGTAQGATQVVVVGGGFEPGASVAFGTLPALQTMVLDAQNLLTLTPPSPAGQVDVTVQNPDGGQAVLPGGYDFSPE